MSDSLPSIVGFHFLSTQANKKKKKKEILPHANSSPGKPEVVTERTDNQSFIESILAGKEERAIRERENEVTILGIRGEGG